MRPIIQQVGSMLVMPLFRSGRKMVRLSPWLAATGGSILCVLSCSTACAGTAKVDGGSLTTPAAIEHLLAEHHLDQALPLAERLYRQDFGRYPSGILLARVQLAAGHYEAAVSTLRTLAVRYPGNSEVNALLANYMKIQRIEELEQLFKEHQYHRSATVGERLFREGVYPYRSGLIQARSEFYLGEVGKSITTYEILAKRYPHDADIAEQLAHVRAIAALTEAHRMVERKQFTAALTVLRPYAAGGSEVARNARALMGTIYLKMHEFGHALAVFNALHEEDPDNSSYSALQMSSLLNAYHDDEALAFYRSLPLGQQPVVLHGVGGSLAPYYTNYIMLYGGGAESTRNYPVDNHVGVAINKSFRNSNLFLSFSRWNRFNEVATNISAIYYFRLRDGYAGQIGATYSPQNNFLAHYSFLAGLSRTIDRTEIFGEVRQIQYPGLAATMLSVGARYYFTYPASLALTGYYVPQTDGYSLMLSPRWNPTDNDEIYANLAWGMAGENLGTRLGIINTPSASVEIGDTWRITQHVSIGAGIFMEYRKALYNRAGGLGYVRYWW
ncbi:tetratricopeptide repeat protein [Acidithiobacillus sp. CV18-2]|nr:tetratricopeptide repeat protein [Igneacidithiobacillus copahuensis]MBU2753629.1 tetratricopeptide repeat protein [Acidithiobacillus sp. CV18-3]MBU2758519.1 tetratricopeptide repeat protein [Acidithiobacillus sp. BN09-2]MBU2776347.1 tetratricopeptide repeat protein [Acidithiobacillus sp. CV18-2]MBU2795263.1 tetratricopeptide repeat protein [Acidithiobacillus sp. VAN18-2]MBU2799511.1 tetratricopeptide repeat protein [Acidithiobacillus sp. VAN18-4]UTV81310.1 tetratricopeptide repeat protein 